MWIYCDSKVENRMFVDFYTCQTRHVLDSSNSVGSSSGTMYPRTDPNSRRILDHARLNFHLLPGRPRSLHGRPRWMRRVFRFLRILENILQPWQADVYRCSFYIILVTVRGSGGYAPLKGISLRLLGGSPRGDRARC